MKTEIVNSKTFFSTRSSKKSPNFSPSKAGKLLEVEQDGKKAGSRGNAYKHTKTGFRTDIQLNVRSNWEANFVRVLNGYDIKFEFEPTVFAFPIKRGTKGYTPKYSKDAREFMEELEVPVVIYYEDIRTEYSSLVLNWEGK